MREHHINYDNLRPLKYFPHEILQLYDIISALNTCTKLAKYSRVCNTQELSHWSGLCELYIYSDVYSLRCKDPFRTLQPCTPHCQGFHTCVASQVLSTQVAYTPSQGWLHWWLCCSSQLFEFWIHRDMWRNTAEEGTGLTGLGLWLVRFYRTPLTTPPWEWTSASETLSGVNWTNTSTLCFIDYLLLCGFVSWQEYHF